MQLGEFCIAREDNYSPLFGLLSFGFFFLSFSFSFSGCPYVFIILFTSHILRGRNLVVCDIFSPGFCSPGEWLLFFERFASNYLDAKFFSFSSLLKIPLLSSSWLVCGPSPASRCKQCLGRGY